MREVPSGLGEAGASLWRGIASTHQIADDLFPVVLNVCRIADHLDSLASELALSPLTVENSRGDQIANPLLQEHRQQLAVFRQILKSLGIGELAVARDSKVSIVDQIAARRAARGVS